MCDHQGMNLEEVKKVSTLSKKEFKREFLDTEVPVVMKEEASHWPAMGKWNKSSSKKNTAIMSSKLWMILEGLERTICPR